MAQPDLKAQSRRIAVNTQSENAAVKYTVSWGSLTTSAVSVSAWSVDDGGLTLANAATPDDHTTTVEATSNGLGTHRLTNKVTFADGLIEERHFDVVVRSNTGEEETDYRQDRYY